MPGTTSNGIPYALPGDAVVDWPTTSKDVADALPVHRVPTALAAGGATVVLSNASAGSVAVTFPVGRFTAAPRVLTGAGATPAWSTAPASVTPSGFTMQVRHVDATAFTGNAAANWFAVQGLG